MRNMLFAAAFASALVGAPLAVQAQVVQGTVNGAQRGAAQGNDAGGPVGGIVGGALGAGVGAVRGAVGTAAGVVGTTTGVVGDVLGVEARPRFREYVVRERMPSYRYAKPLRPGVVLPQAGVTYREVPAEYATRPGYRYAVVNDRPVIVDPVTRTVVEVLD